MPPGGVPLVASRTLASLARTRLAVPSSTVRACDPFQMRVATMGSPAIVIRNPLFQRSAEYPVAPGVIAAVNAAIEGKFGNEYLPAWAGLLPGMPGGVELGEVC